MAKARLLVVDDEQSLVKLYERRLEKMSYDVTPAHSGQEALEILEREEIDVLITDFKMPKMDGCEVITRAMATHPLLQSIVVSGYNDIKTAIAIMGAGAFNYLQKPVDFAELDVAIQKGLEKRRLLLDVQNKQRQLEEYRNHLEELVERRTQALTEANLKLHGEIEERKALEKSLREAKVRAEEASKAKSEFLANMSHEIRTPMTSAIGLLNLVLETQLVPKQKAYLEMARISTVMMQNLLNDILDLSKIDAGRLNLESLSFNPRQVIASVIDLQRLQSEEKTNQLSSVIADDVPEAVTGDPNRLRQIILNLVSNAVKFTQYGEVVIACRQATGGDPGAIDPQHVLLHFSVKDTGIGIEQEKIGLIFEAFTQADSSTTRKYGGVGLGLNICSKLVSMMGGQIWVTSEPGQGSTFHFTARLGVEPFRERGIQEQSEGGIAGIADTPVPQSLNILVVEDDLTNQWVIREILESAGHVVVCASDGKTALRQIAAHCFDLILMDLILPDINGYEIVRHIRTREQSPCPQKKESLPIIALTGLASKQERQKCLDAGMDDFLAKPFTVDQLMEKLQKYARSGSTQPRPQKQEKERVVPNTSILDADIFDEDEALKKAQGNKAILLQRIRTAIDRMPIGIETLRNAPHSSGSSHTFEHGVHDLKEMAMEVGAISLADELFSLLMRLRNKQDIPNIGGQIKSLETAFETFKTEPRIRELLTKTH